VRALELRHPKPIERSPLIVVDRPLPRPGPGQVLVHVLACGACHTDLHLAEGDLPAIRVPVILGHQIVGTILEAGDGTAGWKPGDRIGIPWLHHTDGSCDACRRGEENLCHEARFTGWHEDGGFAEATLAEAEFGIHLPQEIEPERAAPLLCSGIIGYRSLRKADLHQGERLGLMGFGASAHLALQIARYWGCPVAVFTRSPGHRALALDLGAEWAGGIGEEAPWPLDRAILFAPVGALVPDALRKLRPGGTLAVNAIHMTPIPEMPYAVLHGERTLRSVANATRQDGVELLDLAAKIPLRSVVQVYSLEAGNQALADLKHSRLEAAAVIVP